MVAEWPARSAQRIGITRIAHSQIHSVAEESKNEDRKGGTGHNVVLAVVLVFPILKVAWTVGGGDNAWDDLVALEPKNWLDVLMGMVRNSAVLAFVVAVVVSPKSGLEPGPERGRQRRRLRESRRPRGPRTLVAPLGLSPQRREPRQRWHRLGATDFAGTDLSRWP